MNDGVTLLEATREVGPAEDRVEPLLFKKREALVLDPRLGGTTVCQRTAANDYTPDD